jgi:hypothetical protein
LSIHRQREKSILKRRLLSGGKCNYSRLFSLFPWNSAIGEEKPIAASDIPIPAIEAVSARIVENCYPNEIILEFSESVNDLAIQAEHHERRNESIPVGFYQAFFSCHVTFV